MVGILVDFILLMFMFMFVSMIMILLHIYSGSSSCGGSSSGTGSTSGSSSCTSSGSGSGSVVPFVSVFLVLFFGLIPLSQFPRRSDGNNRHNTISSLLLAIV